MIVATKEFKRFVSSFYNGSVSGDLGEPGEFEKWISSCVDFLNQSERRDVADFLGEVLASNASNQDLQDLWMSGRPSYGVRTQDYRGFLELLRVALRR